MKAEDLNVRADLLRGWTTVTLKELGNYVNGRAFKPKEWKEQGLPIVRIQNLNNFDAKFNYSDAEHEEKYRLKNGDLLVAWSASLGVYIWNRGEAWLNQHIFRVEINHKLVTKKFLYYALQEAINELYLKAHGTGMVHVTKPVFEGHCVPLPPLNEQHRIVAKLEKLLAKVNDCQQRLDRIPTILKRFRQSVLVAACSGRLTADWREKHPDVEPASKLIASLQISEPKAHFDTFEKSSSSDIPKTWTWTPLGKLGQLTGGGTPSKSNPDFWNGTIPWLSAKDMKHDRLSDATDHITEDAIKQSSTRKIPQGSILFVVRGMILRHTFPVAITDTVVTVNQDIKALIPKNQAMSEYLFIAIKSIANSVLFSTKEATHGTRRIETPLLQNWAIPIPPLEEQQEIVKRVEALFRKCDRIEERYQKAKAYTDKLTQSILGKAFRGELVPQDPNDEPAEVLLERIRAEKAQQEKQTKAKKKTKHKSTKKKTQPRQLEIPDME